MDGRMDGWMDGKSPHPTGLRPLSHLGIDPIISGGKGCEIRDFWMSITEICDFFSQIFLYQHVYGVIAWGSPTAHNFVTIYL